MLQDKNRNKNTEKSTSTWVNRFETWRKWRNIPSKLQDIPRDELDQTLQLFYAEVRKADGSNYKLDSLCTMLEALDRHLHENRAKFSIVKDQDFEKSRKLLNGKAIDPRQQWKGKRKNKADAFTPSKEEQLWTKKPLGADMPQSINRTMYFTISQHFGTRGSQEHHQLQVQDLKFVCDPQTDQTLFVEWVEGPTKTCQGGLTKMDRRLPQKRFATGDERCPVKLLEKLISL